MIVRLSLSRSQPKSSEIPCNTSSRTIFVSDMGIQGGEYDQRGRKTVGPSERSSFIPSIVSLASSTLSFSFTVLISVVVVR